MDPWNIHVMISELRKVIGHACIETLARRGYRIAVEVIERPRPGGAQKAVTTLYGLSPDSLQELLPSADQQRR
jgi:DNA-binding winged helix-turn-helix (wHTH) protein